MKMQRIHGVASRCIYKLSSFFLLFQTQQIARNRNDDLQKNMAHFIYSRAENILNKLKDCPIDLRRMEYTMLSLKAILLDAEEKQEQNHGLRNWLKELQDVFYQTEDSIDELKWEQEGIGRKVRARFSCSDKTAAHKKTNPTSKMKKLCDHLDEIASKMYEFHLTEEHTSSIRMETAHSFLSATEVSTRHMRPSWQLFYPLTDAPNSYCNSRYVELLNDFIHSKQQFFHIVGEAGIGKSTLAKFFYSHHDVCSSFTSRSWVCVKDGYNTKRLLKEVYSFQDDKEVRDDFTKKQLLLKVQRFLRGQTFLVVFQDLSSKNLEDDRSMLKNLLELGNYGSKIIVTTQNEEIADDLKLKKVYKTKKLSEQNQVNTIIHQAINIVEGLSEQNQVNTIEHQAIIIVEGLSEQNSFSLFKDYAFRDTKEAQNLELIAKQIVEKCKRFPLAIKCVGSLLSSKNRIAEWNEVNNKLCAQEEEDGSILPILRVCYNLMPSYLKPCFLLYSQLPDDRILSSNDVIQLWMAHGLLHSPKENSLSLENTGEKYFMELWSRCFVQEMEEHGLGCWFKLHPLIRKLAHVLTREQTEGLVGTKPDTEIRSIAFRVRDKVKPSVFLANKCISMFKCLRLLYLGNADLQEIPNAIGTLKYLRYLDLQGNERIKQLPNSICKLQSLQTLILDSCSSLVELPNDIANLISLRYLWVTSNKLRLHKNGVGTMTSLRFLAIGGCDNLQILFERPDCLAGLETLMIYNCNALKSLPNEMRYLKSLQNLVIWGCKQLKLTLKEVEFKLQRFTIRELPKVEELPQWLQGSSETLRFQYVNLVLPGEAVNLEMRRRNYY
ncbi:putative disease resistance protein RGA3 [Momordica charantia]|uniref:Disease resistance protein RGA3 n=1 Tax=Momordica charantia TaxID=3673 RepID=A0A6J1DLK5_MOMCH|nr:putative disease resistance protein RGA3 [Momordica charantia]